MSVSGTVPDFNKVKTNGSFPMCTFKDFDTHLVILRNGRDLKTDSFVTCGRL